MRDVCRVPPEGWYCTREAGHTGPCAALPVWVRTRGGRFARRLANLWNRPLRCMLGAHDDMGHMTSDRWYLECQGCGRETPGFDLAAKPPRQSC